MTNRNAKAVAARQANVRNRRLVKLAALVTALIFCLGLGAASVYGETFVPSITSKGAPEVEKAVDKGGNDVTDRLVITPYSDRDELNDKKKNNFENGYDSVDLKEIAKQIDKKVDPENLSVTDLFYVHEENDSGTIELGVQVTIKYDASPKRIVEVFYFDGSKWVKVEAVNNGDGTVTFVVNAYGPYMIVTNTVKEVLPGGDPGQGVSAGSGNGADGVPVSPQTGVEDGLNIPWYTWFCLAMLVIAVVRFTVYRLKGER